MELEFEASKTVNMEEQHCWTALRQESEYYQWRKRNKTVELSRREGEVGQIGRRENGSEVKETLR